MVIVTLQREKCIGCNYCAEFAPEYFRMSKKDRPFGGRRGHLDACCKKEGT